MSFMKNVEDVLQSEWFARSVTAHLAAESWIRLHIRPKPNWMPRRFYMWLLGKLLVQSRFQ